MWALTKPGGGILWYDFVYDNPRNPFCNTTSGHKTRPSTMYEKIDEKEKRLYRIIASACLLVGYGAYWGWVNVGNWLARGDAPRASEVIVCLSDIERIKKAVDLYHKGLAPQIILTAAKEKKGLTSLGVPEERITLAPKPKTT
jgi:hypothetical protein